ncbi:MAG: glutamate racemase [Clostridia bacterium]|nr:glutamate racemase [Clostridia bacterium]MDD4048713.1 glutamate racemase [Clostridia bacterium]
MIINVNAPIGIFDSGVGGLTVVREVLKQLEYESVLYFADTAHVPYGSRHPRELKMFAKSISNYLIEQGCKMIIIACNTSTSLAYEELKCFFSVPVIGVIEPGIEQALKNTKNMKVGVIATQATINNGAYQRVLKIKKPEVQIFAKSCPSFVPLVEKGLTEGLEVEKAVYNELGVFRGKEIDTLILGCTHYPFLKSIIQEVVGSEVKIIDPAQATVEYAHEKLKELNFQATNKNNVYNFITSSDIESFKKRCRVFLGKDLGIVREVRWGKEGRLGK